MNVIHYIGLDVHKKTISYCIKTAAGQIVKEGTVAAELLCSAAGREVYPNPGMGTWRRPFSVPGSTTPSSRMRSVWTWAIRRK
jgi:hypothetical protein